jgi:hypothetical protein
VGLGHGADDPARAGNGLQLFEYRALRRYVIP